MPSPRQRLRQVLVIVANNFRKWHKNPRIFVLFALSLILCFLLSDKAVQFAQEFGTTMQLAEAFVWTFGDANSILLSSLLLVLLFADMPFIDASTPYHLVRTDRKTWLCGQLLYVALATIIYVLFILLVTSLLCARISFIGNVWSETAAVLGYSGAGKAIALPSSVKAMEISLPYGVMATIFVLMTFYSLFIASVMMAVNIKFGQFWGVASVFILNLFGLLLNPEVFKKLLNLPEKLYYQANVAVGWASPLNHATYYMHNFGYDLLPRLWMSYVIFGLLIIGCFALSIRGVKHYSFDFSAGE
jgi:hypothetical protein